MSTAKTVKPTKKNSPAIAKPHIVDGGPASKHAKPRRMSGAPLHMRDTLGIDPDKDSNTGNEVVPEQKTRIRGTGAAERGVYARGPMA
jgi:hypothetical protein